MTQSKRRNQRHTSLYLSRGEDETLNMLCKHYDESQSQILRRGLSALKTEYEINRILKINEKESNNAL
jgi:hypothetical protein